MKQKTKMKKKNFLFFKKQIIIFLIYFRALPSLSSFFLSKLYLLTFTYFPWDIRFCRLGFLFLDFLPEILSMNSSEIVSSFVFLGLGILFLFKKLYLINKNGKLWLLGKTSREFLYYLEHENQTEKFVINLALLIDINLSKMTHQTYKVFISIEGMKSQKKKPYFKALVIVQKNFGKIQVQNLLLFRSKSY